MKGKEASRAGKLVKSMHKIRTGPWRSVEAWKIIQPFFIRFKVPLVSKGVSNMQSRRSGLKHKRCWKPIIYQNRKNKCDLGSLMGCMRLSSHLGWKFHMALASSRANPFGVVKGIYQQSISEYLLSILGRN